MVDDEFAARDHRLDALTQRLQEVEASTDGDWTVYQVTREGDDAPVYIGISSNWRRRCQEHNANPDSAIYELGKVEDLDMRPLAAFKNYEEALLFETMQIALRPGLLNRDVDACRKKLMLPDSFWVVLGEALR